MAGTRSAGQTDVIIRNFRIAVGGFLLYFLILGLIWGRGPALAASPLYDALAEAVTIVAGLAIAFLAYSRYRTLGEPATLAIALAFWVHSIFGAFDLLTHLGIDGALGPVTADSNVAAWMTGFEWTALALGLVASVLTPASAPPGVRWGRLLRLFVLGGAVSAAIAAVTMLLGPALPRLVIGGAYSVPFLAWMLLLGVAFTITARLSIRRYCEGHNRILGQVAVLQLAAAAIVFGHVVGGGPYSLWWYVNHIWHVGSFVGVLFGLLNEYVSLFESERARARQLAALDAITEVGLTSLDADTLLQSLLARLIRELDGRSGAVLLLDVTSNVLVVRTAVSLPEEEVRSVRLRPGEGFVGGVFEGAEPVAVIDQSIAESRMPAELHPAGVQVVLAAPMTADDRPIGVMYVNFTTPRRFADWEVNLMRLAAERASLALDRARLYEDARRREAQARLLAEIGQFLTSALEFGAILRAVADRTATVLASTCVVFLRQEDRLIPEIIAAPDPARLARLRDVLSEAQVLVGEGVIGKVAASGQPLLIPDVTTTAEPVQDIRALLPAGVQSLIAAPLATRGQVLGVLVVAPTRNARSLGEEELRLVVELARQTGAALDAARLHQEIVRQRDFLDTVLRNLPTPTGVFEGPGLIYRLANPALQALAGENVAVVGRKLTEVFPSTAYDGTAALFRRAIETGQPIYAADYEFTGLPRGVTYWNLSLAPLKVEEGRPPSLLMLASETTGEVQARRRVEELARESGQRAGILRAAANAVDEGILLMDPAGNVLLANRMMSQLFNLGPGFFQGRVSSEAVFGWMRQRALDPGAFAAREDYLAGHPEVEAHDEVVLTVPTRRTFLRYSGPVRDTAGSLIGRIEVYRDIAEQRRREREHEAIANAARDLVEQMEMDAVARTVAEHTITALAAQVAAVWLAHPEQHELQLVASRNLSPTTVDELRHERFDAKTVEAVAATGRQPIVLRSMEGASPTVDHTVLVARGEGLRSLVATPLVERGKLVGVLLAGWTSPQELPAAELHLAQTLADLFALALDNARLYESVKQEVRLREEFLAAAAHELKTPLTSLRGYSQLLLRRHPTEANGEHRVLAAIDRSARRIARLGDELIEALNLRRAAPSIELVRFDLRTALEEAVKRWQQGGYENTVRVAPGPLVAVQSDPALVCRLVEHLLDNAARRSPEEAPIDVGVQTGGDRAIVRVRDYGPGIPEERQPHLFEPLYEAHPPGTAGYVGLVGLELYLGRQIVQQLGGDIWFESQPGAGAVVAFSLPLAPAERAEGEQPT